MVSRNGLPPREPGTRLGERPRLPPKAGVSPPFQIPALASEEMFPAPGAEPTVKQASISAQVGVRPALGAPPAAEAGVEPPLPYLVIPSSFEELVYHAVLVNPSREVPVVVEQTIAPGASGSVTVSIPGGFVDIARTVREAGDGSVSYRIEVDGAGRVSVAQHRVLGSPERTFGRFFEKYTSVIISFTNTDPLNAAILQIEWTSVQISTVRWLAYRDVLRAWSRLLGVTE